MAQVTNAGAAQGNGATFRGTLRTLLARLVRPTSLAAATTNAAGLQPAANGQAPDGQGESDQPGAHLPPGHPGAAEAARAGARRTPEAQAKTAEFLAAMAADDATADPAPPPQQDADPTPAPDGQAESDQPSAHLPPGHPGAAEAARAGARRTPEAQAKTAEFLAAMAADATAPPPDPAGALDVRSVAGAELRPKLRGALLLPGDDGYDTDRASYNLAIDHRPAVIVGASGAADVMAAVQFATGHGLPVAVMNSGHSGSVSSDGALLVNTRRMTGVRVDPHERVARIEAGVRWEQVIHETAPFGLAPLSGSFPEVGAVGYTLGGGLGLLGRAFGFAADHVRSIDVVTAGGEFRHVTPEREPDLFWALRGGKGNFGIVTSLEIGLFPVPRLYGGGLFFRGTHAREVLDAYQRWTRTVPDEMGSSVALLRIPWIPEVPPPLRGRFAVHVRVVYHGPTDEGAAFVQPLRAAAPVLFDTVADLPYTDSGQIHNDPPNPVGLHERTTHLRDLDEGFIDHLLRLAGPDSSCPVPLVEIRHLGGALRREPEVPNAIAHRDAAFQLYMTGERTGLPQEPADRFMAVAMEELQPWSTGTAHVNFMGLADAEPDRVRDGYSDEHYERLREVKQAYDPENLFRINHNIPPAGSAGPPS